MKLRALIVDDEPLGRATVRRQCQSAGDVEVVGETASGEEATRLIRQLRPDVVFLDIHMRPVSGLQVAAAIDAPDMPVVVFVTAYDQYAITAFELNALDYLLKPFDEARFQTTLERIRRRIGSGLTDTQRLESQRGARAAAAQFAAGAADSEPPVILEVGGRVHLFRQPSIECVEADGNYLTFWVEGRSYTVRGTLVDLEQQLAPPRFRRIRRSVLINMHHVRHISKWSHGEYLLELTSGRRFTTGRTFRHRLQGIVLRSREPGTSD
ncbi:MAG: LytTR family DNA-binding domain-containing protein [Steroidobacteraceae bacterium]|mgnify:CR=1 FL=1